jgi:NADPH:quinone reductase-like Zn-dependent oxidoreductase
VQAVRVEETGGPERLQLVDVPGPEPGAGQVRVRIEHAGVNFIDVYHRSGAVKVPTPFTPGMEAAGTIDAPALRELVDAGTDVDDIVASWRDELADFHRRREAYLIYPPTMGGSAPAPTGAYQ